MKPAQQEPQQPAAAPPALDLEAVEAGLIDTLRASAPPLAWLHVLAALRLGRVVHAALRLGIVEAVAQGPQSAAGVARGIGADPIGVRRLLRGLAAAGLLEEAPLGQFGLSEMGHALRADASPNLADPLLEFFEPPLVPFDGLITSVASGKPAFELRHGRPFFEHMAQEPARAAGFDAQMSAGAERRCAALLAAADFPDAARVIDVGGGEGILLGKLLLARPHLEGVLLEAPATALRARAALERAGLSARCSVIDGDFFEHIPPHADVYLLSFVLHDWEDEKALKILRTLRRAMRAGARLLVIEQVRDLSEPASFVEYLDLDILELLQGRERTQGEFRTLLEQAGLALERVHPGAPPFSVLEAYARP